VQIEFYRRIDLPFWNLVTLTQEPLTPLLPTPSRRLVHAQTLFDLSNFDRRWSSRRKSSQAESSIGESRTFGTEIEVSGREIG